MNTKTVLFLALISAAAFATYVAPDCNAPAWTPKTYSLDELVTHLGGAWSACDAACKDEPQPSNILGTCWSFLGSCNPQYPVCAILSQWDNTKWYFGMASNPEAHDNVIFDGAVFKAYNNHKGSAKPWTGPGRDHWEIIEAVDPLYPAEAKQPVRCSGVCEHPWVNNYYYKGGWLVFHNGKIWRAKSENTGHQPGTKVDGYEAWTETTYTCPIPEVPDEPVCAAGDAPAYNPAKKDYKFGDKVISEGALFVFCGEETCQFKPGFDSSASLVNSCWVYLGSCLGTKTCANAPTWSNDNRQYYMGDNVIIAGKLFRAYRHHRSSHPHKSNENWGFVAVCNDCQAAFDASFYYAGGWKINYNGIVWVAKWWVNPNSDLPPNNSAWQSTAQTCAGGNNGSPTTPDGTDPSTDGTGCNAPAWVSTKTYTTGDQVKHNGRAWVHKNWGTGTYPAPGSNLWGVWELLTWCTELPNCCTDPSGQVAWKMSTHFWAGECTKENGIIWQATQNNFCHNPRWNPQDWTAVC